MRIIIVVAVLCLSALYRETNARECYVCNSNDHGEECADGPWDDFVRICGEEPTTEGTTTTTEDTTTTTEDTTTTPEDTTTTPEDTTTTPEDTTTTPEDTTTTPEDTTTTPGDTTTTPEGTTTTPEDTTTTPEDTTTTPEDTTTTPEDTTTTPEDTTTTPEDTTTTEDTTMTPDDITTTPEGESTQPGGGEPTNNPAQGFPKVIPYIRQRRSLQRENTTNYQCFAFKQSDNVVRRGCTTSSETTLCTTGRSDCKVCDDDLCNSGMKISGVSSMLLALGAVLYFTR